MTPRHLSVIAATSFTIALSSITAIAAQINTGGPTGAYHSTFCPNLARELDRVGQPSQCLTSAGTGENLARVSRNPTELGFGQLDVFALEAPNYRNGEAFDVVRTDDVRECVFAVTRNRQYTNYGEIAVNADRLRFILPPKTSGSAKTFEYLSKIDPDGIGQARTIEHADSTDAALDQALSSDDAVSFFVQFPDPANPRFRTIKQRGGHIVPVVDGILLNQEIDGRTVYFAQETPISQSKWLNLGSRVVTVCTPLVLFTGAEDGITDDDQRRIHRQLVLNIRAMSQKELIPEASPIAKVIASTRQLSARARFHFQELSLNARERARPMLDRMYRGATHLVRLMILKARPPEYREATSTADDDREPITTSSAPGVGRVVSSEIVLVIIGPTVPRGPSDRRLPGVAGSRRRPGRWRRRPVT